MKKNRLVVALAILFAGSTAYGLDVSDGSGASYNPLQTAVPALSIAPDAVGGGMGDVGAATAPDLASQYWNPSKYALAQSRGGLSISYTPWLRKIVSDIDLVYLSGYFIYLIKSIIVFLTISDFSSIFSVACTMICFLKIFL